jgi:hypothetical protein
VHGDPHCYISDLLHTERPVHAHNWVSAHVAILLGAAMAMGMQAVTAPRANIGGGG